MANEDEQPDDLPRALVDELESADRPMPLITARVDREIAAQARSHFAARRQPARVPRSAWAAMAATAATVLLAVLMLQSRAPLPPASDDVYADVDGSGRVDIADVLALARAREAGERSRAELDAFAMRIVTLEPREDEDAS